MFIFKGLLWKLVLFIVILISVTGGISAQDDSDGDGLEDSEDRCPQVAGPIDNGGCPLEQPEVPQDKGGARSVDDRDGDGVADFVDNCPDRAGTGFNGGCPAGETVPPLDPTTPLTVLPTSVTVAFPAVDLCLIGTADTVNVRTQPTVNSDIVQQIGPREVLLVSFKVTTLLGETWLYTPGAANGMGGYVRADVVNTNNFCGDADLPVLSSDQVNTDSFDGIASLPVTDGIDWEDVFDGGLVILNAAPNATTRVLAFGQMPDTPPLSIMIDGVEVVNNPLNPRTVVVAIDLPEVEVDCIPQTMSVQAVQVPSYSLPGSETAVVTESEQQTEQAVVEGSASTTEMSDEFSDAAVSDGSSDEDDPDCPDDEDNTDSVLSISTDGVEVMNSPLNPPTIVLAIDLPEVDVDCIPQVMGGVQNVGSGITAGQSGSAVTEEVENKQQSGEVTTEDPSAQAPPGSDSFGGVADSDGSSDEDDSDCPDDEDNGDDAILIFPPIGDQPGECPEYEFNARFTPARGAQTLDLIIPSRQPSSDEQQNTGTPQFELAEEGDPDCDLLLIHLPESGQNSGQAYRLSVPLQGGGT